MKSIQILLLILLITTQSISIASSKQSTDDDYFACMKQYGLKAVQSAPKGVTVLEFANTTELEKYLNSIQSPLMLIAKPNNLDGIVLPSSAFTDITTINYNTIISVGNYGNVISKVKYSYRYDDLLSQKIMSSISYHDVYLDGGYINTTLNVYEKTATINSSSTKINVYVRGRLDVYVSVVGQTITVSHYDFEKSYTIN
jgi:hypothetical protein